MTARIGSKLLHCRQGSFALAFALMLPELATLGAYAADQANIAILKSRVAKARDAANLAVAVESVRGNMSRGQLEAYAKDFFLANLGAGYAEASSVKLVMPSWPKVGGVRLEAQVRCEPLLAPTCALTSSGAVSDFAVVIH